MITPSAYEHLIAQYFEQRGYRTQVTSLSNDYGLDVLAENEHERVAIQAKLYGNTSRPVNRQMVMELHGVKDYFDCARAVIATDGNIRADAREVATKLGITFLKLSPDALRRDASTSSEATTEQQAGGAATFDTVWVHHIMPLAGTTIVSEDGRTNEIVTVDWSGIKRISSNGRTSRIGIEIFRLAINKILTEGSITREEINQNYEKRASSAVTLILSQVPFFKLERRPKFRLSYLPDAQ